jgi:DNA-nicking Smr family endonuclease
MLTESDKNLWKAWVDKYMHTNINIKKIWNINKNDALSTRLDLHGITVNEAYHAVAEFVEQHQLLKTKKVIVVTGKSGIISKEFKSWLGGFKCVSKAEAINDSRGGVGSYRLWLSQH